MEVLTNTQAPTQLTREQIAEYKTVFDSFDTDGSGAVSLEELGGALKNLGMAAEQDRLNDLMEEVDTDKSREIEFEEFLQLVAKKVGGTAHFVQTLKDVFVKFDSDSDGFLNAQDLVYALKQFAQTDMTIDEAKEVMQDVDPEGSGRLNEDAFIQLMLNP
eukprot:Rhum_TRINITY_DN14648_c0_g2::Rhum_TRINITY_DN14648_c0_g2_i1::g.107547::m.107547/K02183/CALM; calmodulin